MSDMTPARRRAALLVIAVGMGLIVQRTIASAGDSQVVAPAGRGPRTGPVDVAAPAPASVRQAGAVAPALRLDRLAARGASAPTGEGQVEPPLFAAQSWLPPTPPPPPAAAPEPVAPPFPYAYLGGLSDEHGRTAFFNRGERVLTVRAGEIVDGSFRVDLLDETSMTVTYVPLNKTAQVLLGGAR